MIFLLIGCVTKIIPETCNSHHIFVNTFYLNRIKKQKEGLLHLKLLLKTCDSWIDFKII